MQSVSRVIPVQTMQSAGLFQYKMFSQQDHACAKYAVSRDVPVQNIQILVQNMQSVGTFQYKTFSQQDHSCAKYAVSRDVPV
jgi:hypothetical protein